MHDSPSPQKVVVGIGEILWDRFPTGDRLGGAPANFAYHAAQLGAEAYVVSRVGDDPDGEAITRRLSGRTDYLQHDYEHATGVVEVALEKGEPTYTIADPAAWDFLVMTESLRALAARADAVCFGTLAQRREGTRGAIREFVEACSPHALRLFDLNLRAPFFTPEIIKDGLELANILKLNEGEVREVTALFGLSAADPVPELFALYPRLKLIAVTLGEKGSAVYVPGVEPIRSTPPKVEFCDAVGAGDSFAATLVTGLLAGQPVDRIADLANRIAAFVASESGATPLLPDNLRTF